MNLADVHKAAGTPRKKRKRVGRGPGSGRGKTATRGHNGARSRSGWKARLAYEGGQMSLVRRLPKRGFNNAAFREAYEVVNVKSLARFDAGSTVGPEELRAAKVARTPAKIKILAEGELDRALTVRAHKFSKSAAEKIKAAGGTPEVI
ncbi:MAG: 50S ribosomal protein L15 [Planctomycetota bacterium]|jgi:large subunit ribosomal protein L15